MTDERESPVAPPPAKPVAGQLTPAEKVMLGLLIVLVGGLFVAIVTIHGSIVEVQRQIGDLRAEVHQETGDLERQIGNLRTDLERQINDLRTDLGQRMGSLEERMARLAAIMVAHLGTPPPPTDGPGDNAPAQ